MINITYEKAGLSEKTVVALGLFDGVHKGHQDVIKKACDYRSLGLVPAVFTFKTNSLKSKRNEKFEYLITDEQKAIRLKALGVEYLCSPDFTEVMHLTPEEFVTTILKRKLNAKIVVCGEDFTFGKGGTADAKALEDICSKHDIMTIVVPFAMYGDQPISSTAIREKLKKGDIKSVNAMLGYDYAIRLTVVHGRKLGRKLAFPTINQLFPDGMIVAKNGVYASRSYVDNRYYMSITNIGIRPTVNREVIGEKIPIAETYILGFDGDLYGKRIKVELKKFIRDEKKFSSLEDLKGQISIDTKKVVDLFSSRKRR